MQIRSIRLATSVKIAAMALVAGLLATGPVVGAPTADEMEMQGWTFLTSSDDTMVYMKHAETKTSETRQVWTLYNSETKREREGYSFMSVTSLGEYHCGDKKSRILQEHFYEQPALKGEHHELGGEVPTAWDEHTPGSIGEIKFEFACDLTEVPSTPA